MIDLKGAAKRQIALWREDLRRLVMDCFKPEKIEPFQEEALLAASGERMREKPRLAMKASKGPGKTTGLAWLALAFMATREHLNGYCMSISGDNLRDNLWKEMAKWHNRSEFHKAAFELTARRYFAKDYKDTWWLSARNWKKDATPEEQADTLSGLHQDNVCVIADETGGYPSAVMATADAILASCKWGFIAQAGNPTHLEGPLYDAVTKHRSKWVVITINGDPDNPDRATRVSKAWAQEQIDMYGRDNPWVLVNVFGEFPPSSINTLLGPDDVEKAMKRWGAIKENEYNFAQKRIGCDTARFGDDPNVFFPRQGLIALTPVVMRNQRGPVLAARVALMRRRWGGKAVIFIDDTGGYGATLEDNLHTAGIPYVPVNFGGKAIDPRYANKRSEIIWELAQWVLRGGCLPSIPGLQEQLTKTHYTFTKKAQLIVEEKDQIKANLGGMSPNEMDALATTFALPDMADMDSEEGRELIAASGQGEIESEWDPFDEDR